MSWIWEKPKGGKVPVNANWNASPPYTPFEIVCVIVIFLVVIAFWRLLRQ
jgi:hypothetical protein